MNYDRRGMEDVLTARDRAAAGYRRQPVDGADAGIFARSVNKQRISKE